jgi:ParB-like chromosome segregation protein Spo0J
MLPNLQPLAVPLESLSLDPRNARSHGGRSTQSQMESLKAFGQVKPIIGNRRNRQIVAGNGLYMAMAELHKQEPARWTHIAVAWGDYDDKTQAKLALADNRTAELSSWDDAALADICALIEEEDQNLFDALGLEELLPELTPEDLGAETKVPAQRAAKGGKLKTYQVVVECSDSADRRRLMTSLKKQGRRCRALTWEGEVKMPGGEEEGETGRRGEREIA